MNLHKRIKGRSKDADLESTTSATLTFPHMDLAKQFGADWGRFSFTGHDRSSVSACGSVSVTVYHVDEAKKQWIDSWIRAHNTLTPN